MSERDDNAQSDAKKCRWCRGRPSSTIPRCEECDGGWVTWCELCDSYEREDHECPGLMDEEEEVPDDGLISAVVAICSPFPW